MTLAIIALVAAVFSLIFALLARRRMKRAELELAASFHQSADPGMEIAMVTISLGEAVFVNQQDDGTWVAESASGRKASGRDPGEAARGLLD